MEFCRQRSKSRQNQPKCQTPQTFSVCFSIVAFSKFQHSLWKYFPEKSLKSCRLSRMLENWSWPRLVSTCEAPPLGASQAKLLTWKEANCRKKIFFFTHNIFVCAWNNEHPPFPWPKPGSFAQLWKWIKIFQPKNSLKSFYCVLLVFYIFTSKFIGLPALRGGSKVWGSFVCLWMFSLAGWNKILACPSTIIIMDQSSNMRLFDNADFFPAYNHSIKSICQVVYGGIPYLARPLLCQTFAFHRLQSRMEYF